jgi:hypothetical protein
MMERVSEWGRMWNKTKWFCALLVAIGCILIWTTFLPIPLTWAYSYYFQQIGILFVGAGLGLFVLICIILGINSVFRFKREPHFVIFRSKKVTKFVGILIMVLLSVTAFLWWLIPYVLRIGVLSPSEVRQHSGKYLEKEITVEGYYGGPGILEPFFPHVGAISEEYPWEDPLKVIGVETSGIKNITLVEGNRYRFKGILKQTKSVNPSLAILFPVTLVASQANPI